MMPLTSSFGSKWYFAAFLTWQQDRMVTWERICQTANSIIYLVSYFQFFALWPDQQLENIVQHGRHSVHHGRDHKRLGVITCEELQSVNCLSGKKIAIFSHHCGLTQHLLILWTMTRKKTTTKRNKTGDKVFCCYGDNISNLLFLFFGVSLPLLWIHQILYLLDFCQVLRMRTQKFSLYLQ